ncbi:MAG: transglycosylase domain-containing protein [Bacteroidetes bacterium]|nr:transglycosylase domain-containing protein [Bacteroidota bacterium]
MKNKFLNLSKKKKYFILFYFILFYFTFSLWYCFCLPSKLFKDPTSTVLEDKTGILLGAKIADDGQWRFPYNEKIPGKFSKAITNFEDKYFYKHPGINPVSIFRAFKQNVKAGKIKSGGSTLTMQAIRLSRKGRQRTFFEKIIEVILATRLEFSFSKKEILSLYASNAPFGGNVVGLDAASWRYFGRKSEELSWSEAATLAVLPNSPALIYPGKNHNKLLVKRNRLLVALWKAGEMDSLSCVLAQSEPLPEKPFPLPRLSPHLLDRASKEGMNGQTVSSTLDVNLQERIKNIVEKRSLKLHGNQIFNAAAIVADVETGNVIAYVGNVEPQASSNSTEDGERERATPFPKGRVGDGLHGESVDIITSPRSTGSIMKPFLFSAMLSDGEILSNTLVPDIPMQIGDFSPQNYYLTYDGAVPARRALSRSLNVPCVKMLQQYGVDRFHYYLKKLGITTLNYPADHYGLTLILGGAEATLWDLAGVYASMARKLNYSSSSSRPLPFRESAEGDWHKLKYFTDKVSLSLGSGQGSGPDPASIYLTFEAMAEVNRPEIDASWQMFSSSSKIAWKTGTSFGYRDGWTIGVTPKYVVGVWVGNANGEGRPNLTGVGTAAPILFEIFGVLGKQDWFKMPQDAMQQIEVCKESGYRALPICEHKEKQWVQSAGLKTAPCPYHRLVHLDATGRWRVNSDCEEVSNMIHKSWFVLPPAMEWYYKSKNTTYSELPPFRVDCKSSSNVFSMELLYPKQESKIFVPVELDESTGKTVFRVAHRKSETTIYWHLDDNYIGSTKGIHQMGLSPKSGQHTLTLVDEFGETITQRFEIIGKK